MRDKLLLSLFVFCMAMFVLKTEAFAKDCRDNDIKASAQTFIEHYYEDIQKGDKTKIKNYFFEKPDKESIKILARSGRIISEKPFDEEDLEHILHSGKTFAETLERIEFLEMRIISEKPLIIEFDIMLVFKPDNLYGPYDEILLYLKKVDGCKWKILDITMPGMP